jgi:type IV pilus assembly protein PilO
MNKFLEELRTLDTKNPGNWPWPVKIAALMLIFLLIFVAAYFIVYQSQREELEKEANKETSLRATFLEKQKLAVNLEAYQQQRAEIEQSFGALLKQLPTKSQVDALIIDINQAGLGRGLQFELFKPSQAETVTEFYAERPINLKVTGNYHDLGAFASDVSKLPRIVLLNDLKVDTGKDGTGPLSMEAVARTFRYLDPEEVAAQRKTSKDAQAKKAGGK